MNLCITYCEGQMRRCAVLAILTYLYVRSGGCLIDVNKVRLAFDLLVTVFRASLGISLETS